MYKRKQFSVKRKDRDTELKILWYMSFVKWECDNRRKEKMMYMESPRKTEKGIDESEDRETK